MSVMKREFNLTTGHREQEEQKKATERVVEDLEKRRIVQNQKAREFHQEMLKGVDDTHKRQIRQFEQTRQDQERVSRQDWIALNDRHERQQTQQNLRHDGIIGRVARTIDITGTIARNQQKERHNLEEEQARERRKLQNNHDRWEQNLAKERDEAVRSAAQARKDIQLEFDKSQQAQRDRYAKVQNDRVKEDTKRALSKERAHVRSVRSRGIWDD